MCKRMYAHRAAPRTYVATVQPYSIYRVRDIPGDVPGGLRPRQDSPQSERNS